MEELVARGISIKNAGGGNLNVWSVAKPELKQNGRFTSHVMEALSLTVIEDITYEANGTGYIIFFLSGVTGYLEF